MEAAVAGRKAIFHQSGQRVQHHLPMAEIDALRPAGRSRRVENRGDGVLVEVREREIGRADRQQRLVFGLDRKVGPRRFGPVVHQDVGLHRLQMGRELLDERQEVGVEQHRRRAAVDDRVGDVLGNEADVHRLHHRAHHRDGEIAFVIAVAVPFEHRDDVALVDADLGEAARQPADPFAKLAIGAAAQVAIDDLLIGRARHRRMQEMLDQQRIGVGRRRRRYDLDRHGDPSVLPFFGCSLSAAVRTRIDADQPPPLQARRQSVVRREVSGGRPARKKEAAGPLGRNGVQVPSGWASRSATTHSAAGLKPSPRCEPRTSTFSLSRSVRLKAGPPGDDSVRAAVDRGAGNRQRLGERFQLRSRPRREGLPGQPPPGGADVGRRRRGERAAERDRHAHRVRRNARGLARDQAAAAPADQRDRRPRRSAKRADLGRDSRQIRPGGPDIAPAIPAVRLIAEELQIKAQRRSGPVGRAEPRQNDHRLGRAARSGRKQRRRRQKSRGTHKASRFEGEQQRRGRRDPAAVARHERCRARPAHAASEDPPYLLIAAVEDFCPDGGQELVDDHAFPPGFAEPVIIDTNHCA